MTAMPRRLGACSLAAALALTGACSAKPADVGGDRAAAVSAAGSTVASAGGGGTSTSSKPGSHTTTSSTPAADKEQMDLPDVAGRWNIAVTGTDGQPQTIGDSSIGGSAWSTIKVPLAIAAYREHGDDVAEPVEQAIVASNNDSAAQLWESLGTPDEAGAAVDAVLDELDSPNTVTQREQVRPPYSPFGQTKWKQADQVAFAEAMACSDDPAVKHVFGAMGRIIPEKQWGLSVLEDPRYKGGTGPEQGTVLMRQIGVVTVDGDKYAVAMTVLPDVATVEAGSAELTVMGEWLGENLPDLAQPIDCG